MTPFKFPHALIEDDGAAPTVDLVGVDPREHAMDCLLDFADILYGDIVLVPFEDGKVNWANVTRDSLTKFAGHWSEIDREDVPRLGILTDSFTRFLGDGTDDVSIVTLWRGGTPDVRQIEGNVCPAAHHLITDAIIDDEPLRVIRVAADEPAKESPKADNDNYPPNEARGIRLLSFAEFKAQENSTADSLIKGLVRSGTLIAIGGRPGAGKTALTLAMAAALDDGKPFIGRDTKPTTVVVIAAEDGGDVANRLEAMGNNRIKIAKLPEGLPLTKPPKAAAVAREVIRQAKALDPDRHVMIVVDTLRAALGGVSVLEDKTTSPALNALREVAESEGAVVAVLNHTNRENNKATKGETLEAVAALELVLLEGEGDWFTIYVGKNRSGPGHRNIGKVRYTSANVGGVTAAVVDEIVADETVSDGPKERSPSDNAKMLQGIIRTAILESSNHHMPFGGDGPTVKTVRVEDVRSRFYERKEGSADTKNKAFNRALGHWIDKEWIVRGGAQDDGLLWFGSSQDEKAG